MLIFHCLSSMWSMQYIFHMKIVTPIYNWGLKSIFFSLCVNVILKIISPLTKKGIGWKCRGHSKARKRYLCLFDNWTNGYKHSKTDWPVQINHLKLRKEILFWFCSSLECVSCQNGRRFHFFLSMALARSQYWYKAFVFNNFVNVNGVYNRL